MPKNIKRKVKQIFILRVDNVLLLPAPWVLAISQDRNQERLPDTNVDEEKVLLSLCTREPTREKEKRGTSPRKAGQGF